MILFICEKNILNKNEIANSMGSCAFRTHNFEFVALWSTFLFETYLHRHTNTNTVYCVQNYNNLLKMLDFAVAAVSCNETSAKFTLFFVLSKPESWCKGSIATAFAISICFVKCSTLTFHFLHESFFDFFFFPFNYLLHFIIHLNSVLFVFHSIFFFLFLFLFPFGFFVPFYVCRFMPFASFFSFILPAIERFHRLVYSLPQFYIYTGFIMWIRCV